jgi:sarcosine oxidase
MSADAPAKAIVVGLGAMGSAACFHLARRGVSVIGIDQFAPPHAYGSTHGDTRITRLAVGEGAEYIPLVQRSHRLWRELEAESGARLLTQCGGVILSRPGSPFFEQTRALAQQFGIEHERLDNRQLRRRLPMFAADEETEAYHEPGAGIVWPETAVRTHLELAHRDGARLCLGERVTGWSGSPAGVTVTTDAGNHSADRLVLCAGAWLPQLVPEARPLLAVYRQLLHWFEIREGYERLRDMPVFVWDFGGERGEFVHLDGFYGFPAVDGRGGGLKVGSESYETTSEPDGRQHPATRAQSENLYRDYVGPRLPWLGPRTLRSASCLYTSTRANRFVIDEHPENDAVLIVSACSGHGFKHSPAIGEAAARWATGERTATELDLSGFRLGLAMG